MFKTSDINGELKIKLQAYNRLAKSKIKDHIE